MHSTTITAALMAAVLVTASPVNRPRTELTSVLGSLGAVQEAVSSLGILKKSVKEGVEGSAHRARTELTSVLGSLGAVQEAVSSLGILKKSVKDTRQVLDGVDVSDPLNPLPVDPNPVVPDLSNQTTIEFNTTIPNLLNDTTVNLNTTITDPLTNTTINFNSTVPNLLNQTTVDLNTSAPETVEDTIIPDPIVPGAGLKSSHTKRQDLAQMLSGMLNGTPQNVDHLNLPDLTHLTNLTGPSTTSGSIIKSRQFQAPGTLGPLGPGLNATIPDATRFNITTGTLLKSAIKSARVNGTAPSFIKPRQFQALNSVLAPLGLNVTDLGLLKKVRGEAGADATN